MKLCDADFFTVERCPWCGAGIENSHVEYYNLYDCPAYRCHFCKIVYAGKRLNEKGLKKYWENYESQVHCNSERKVEQRNKMYQIEFEHICKYMGIKNKKILDVGCGNGDFLLHFIYEGGIGYGIEFGEEAIRESQRKFKCYGGELPEIEIEEKFDLIIFRGTIQYFPTPRRYFEKAIRMLNPGGMIYITSSPNSDSICFKLYKEKFVIPVGVSEYCGFNPHVLTEYFKEKNFKIVDSRCFYKETPYADVENDIRKVAKALELVEAGVKIEEISPAFFDNMITLIVKAPDKSLEE